MGIQNNKAKRDGVRLKSETGAMLMNLEAFHREGNKMIIEGTIVGSWKSKIYVNYEDAWLMFRKLLTWEMLVYTFWVPIWIIKKKWKKWRQK